MPGGINQPKDNGDTHSDSLRFCSDNRIYTEIQPKRASFDLFMYSLFSTQWKFSDNFFVRQVFVLFLSLVSLRSPLLKHSSPLSLK